MDNKLEYSKISDVEFEDIDHNDYPDYCDAYIIRAKYDGVEMTEEQLELLNDDHDFKYQKLFDIIF